jgi:hypothetical protein
VSASLAPALLIAGDGPAQDDCDGEHGEELDVMNLRHGLVALAMAAAAHTIGCGCGVEAAPGPNNQDGAVVFDSVAVGSSEELPVPFQDSADTSETIMGATITGSDAAAFEVISKFPIGIAAGDQAEVTIRFAPTHVGSSTATRVLQTEEMGPSPVQLEGTGIAAGG